MGLALVWVGGETHDARKSVKTGNPRVQVEGYMRWKVFYRETGTDGFGGQKCVVKYKCKFYSGPYCWYFVGSFYLRYFYTASWQYLPLEWVP